ncbi:MAG: apolipoprotein N-acyltransferase [Elusimicrobiaceae bacterium]|nr:apolipoprotein N-acyltransferase [Elusimicrobiaceae bacterium]
MSVWSRLLAGLRCGGRYLFLSGGALATALLVFLSFPRYSHSSLAWVAWVPFLWGVTKIRGFWASFFYGWVTALLFHAGLFYWIYYTCRYGGGLSVGLALAAWLGLCALLSLQFALLGGSCYFLKKAGPFFPLLVACGFVTLEWLHQTIAFYALGFPWLMWGYSQWNMPTFLQVAAYTGVYGVSFLLVCVSALLAKALSCGLSRKSVFYVLVAVGVWLGAYGWGNRQIPIVSTPSLLHVSAALMQPNIDQYKKWDDSFEAEITDTIYQMGQALTGHNILLTVWPESVLPGEISEEKYFDLMQDVSARSGAYQVVGSSLSQGTAQYVGAYLMTPYQDTLQEYKKVKLVPFGEYIPLEKTVRALFPHVDILGELGVFSPGSKNQPLLNAGGILLGSTLCYEAIFPQLWRVQNKLGAKLFVNLTNDAWFFDTAAPYQHLAANVLRAVETHRPLLRAANTGFSAVIDPFGRIEYQTALFTQDILYAQVPLQADNRVSLYTQWGDVFAWLCVAVFMTGLILLMVFAYE